MGKNQPYPPQQGGVWRCPCGQENESVANFCVNCGQPRPAVYFDAGMADDLLRPAAAWPVDAVPGPKRKTGWLIPVLLVMIVLALIGTALVLWAPWKSKTPSAAIPVVTPVPAGETAAATEEAAAPAGEAASEEVTAAEETYNPYAGSYEITVWVSDAQMELTCRQIEEFNAANPFGIVIRATILSVSEGDVSGWIGTTPENAGVDLYVFPSDQLAQLVQAHALAPLDRDAAALVQENNDAGSVNAATVDGRLYAYPITSDNGYFLYYDKSVIPDGDADSLERILADCQNAGKYFAFETSSGWYVASFFFGTGCVSEWSVDAGGNFIGMRDTFNSDAGLVAMKGLQTLVQSPVFLDSSTAWEFENNAAAVVSGTWDYETALMILGDNLGVAELPSFKVDGRLYHLGSFAGYKMLGVMPQADAVRAEVLHLLAGYLSGEDCQMERFRELSWIPSNRNAQALPEVKAAPAARALARQSEYATNMSAVFPEWWGISMQLASAAQNAPAGDEFVLRMILADYEDMLSSAFQGIPYESGWYVIGSICGTSWDTDFPMQEESPNVFCSERMYLVAGEELKVRKNHSWEYNFGVDGRDGENLRVDASGSYYVILDLNNETIYLRKA